MPRPKGSQNKVTTEVKELLRDLTNSTINSIRVEELDYDQRIKLLQVTLHYIVPKLRSVENTEKKYEDEPIFLEVWGRKDESNEDVWKDNFEVVDIHIINPKKTD